MKDSAREERFTGSLTALQIRELTGGYKTKKAAAE